MSGTDFFSVQPLFHSFLIPFRFSEPTKPARGRGRKGRLPTSEGRVGGAGRGKGRKGAKGAAAAAAAETETPSPAKSESR